MTTIHVKNKDDWIAILCTPVYPKGLMCEFRVSHTFGLAKILAVDKIMTEAFDRGEFFESLQDAIKYAHNLDKKRKTEHGVITIKHRNSLTWDEISTGLRYGKAY